MYKTSHTNQWEYSIEYVQLSCFDKKAFLIIIKEIIENSEQGFAIKSRKNAQ